MWDTDSPERAIRYLLLEAVHTEPEDTLYNLILLFMYLLSSTAHHFIGLSVPKALGRLEICFSKS